MEGNRPFAKTGRGAALLKVKILCIIFRCHFIERFIFFEQVLEQTSGRKPGGTTQESAAHQPQVTYQQQNTQQIYQNLGKGNENQPLHGQYQSPQEQYRGTQHEGQFGGQEQFHGPPLPQPSQGQFHTQGQLGQQQYTTGTQPQMQQQFHRPRGQFPPQQLQYHGPSSQYPPSQGQQQYPDSQANLPHKQQPQYQGMVPRQVHQQFPGPRGQLLSQGQQQFPGPQGQYQPQGHPQFSGPQDQLSSQGQPPNQQTQESVQTSPSHDSSYPNAPPSSQVWFYH